MFSSPYFNAPPSVTRHTSTLVTETNEQRLQKRWAGTFQKTLPVTIVNVSIVCCSSVTRSRSLNWSSGCNKITRLKQQLDQNHGNQGVRLWRKRLSVSRKVIRRKRRVCLTRLSLSSSSSKTRSVDDLLNQKRKASQHLCYQERKNKQKKY